MMKIFSWVTKDTTINFMGARKLTYVLSVGMFVLAIACIAFKGFNYGIDFSGGILIELKAVKSCSDDSLKKLSEAALQQMIDRKYDTEMVTKGIKTIYKYGVAFSGKRVEISII